MYMYACIHAFIDKCCVYIEFLNTKINLSLSLSLSLKDLLQVTWSNEARG